MAEKVRKEGKRKEKKKEEDLSEEDKRLKERIDEYCQALLEDNKELRGKALDLLCQEVKGSTTSMTSVPKPFKFLQAHYQSLVDLHKGLEGDAFKEQLADFLSVLSMTMGPPDKMLCLKYLLEGTKRDYKNWGHEYLSRLASDIGKSYNDRIQTQNTDVSELIELVQQILPEFMKSNSETDAIDLLMEVDKLQYIVPHINADNYQRVLLYLSQCAFYSADQEEMVKTLNICYSMSLAQAQYINALRMALKLNKEELIQQVFALCKDPAVLKQLCLLLARQRITIELNALQEDENLWEIASNQLLSKYFLALAKDLETLEPKKAAQVFKSEIDMPSAQANIDSLLHNLAVTYVNGFVNLGTQRDSLLFENETKETASWLFKLKNEAQMAVGGSIGMLCLWDQETGSEKIQEYLDLEDGFARSGACIGVGLYNTGVQDQNDTAKAILSDFLEEKREKNRCTRIGAIIGLGLAYAGSAREDFIDTLVPIIADNTIEISEVAFAALTIGLIFVGKCNEEAANAILCALMEREAVDLDQSVARFLPVALGLLFLGQQEAAEATIEALSLVAHNIQKYAKNCVEGCAYVGSGNVLKVQKMFRECIEHIQGNEAAYQAQAVLCIAVIASSEEVGNEMVVRSMNHLLQYADIQIKRVVPLALAMLNLSNPKITIQDLLQKMAHDLDPEMSYRAILSLGLIGFGTNNSRLAGILRQLALFYQDAKFASHMFVIRIAQGFLHSGKVINNCYECYLNEGPGFDNSLLFGTLSAFQRWNGGNNNFPECLPRCRELVARQIPFPFILFGALHLSENAVYGNLQQLTAFQLNEDLEHKPTTVRVGQAIDIVGQAGQPKKITGFQTHESPVILAHGERSLFRLIIFFRAELATEEFIPIQEMPLENIIILKKNPDYIPEEEQTKQKKH